MFCDGKCRRKYEVGKGDRECQFQIEWPYLVSLKKWYLNKDPKETNK